MFSLLSWVFSLMAMACLSAAMSKHQRDIFQQTPSLTQTKLLHWAGWCLLALSLLPEYLQNNPSIALPHWLGIVTFTALATALILAYKPQRLLLVNSCSLIMAAIIILDSAVERLLSS
ncbi:MAG: DUF3325 domain-containing protein [Parahaliea sp.]